MEAGVYIRFTRGSRKHRIGRAHARFVLENTEPIVTPATEEDDPQLVWIGPDDRGIELEIVAIVLPEYWLVIHVMPTQYRERSGNG
jgi:hypothetical protein